MHGHLNVKHTSTNILSEIQFFTTTPPFEHDFTSPWHIESRYVGQWSCTPKDLLPVLRNRPWPFSSANVHTACILADQPEVLCVFWFPVPGTITSICACVMQFIARLEVCNSPVVQMCQQISAPLSAFKQSSPERVSSPCSSSYHLACTTRSSSVPTPWSWHSSWWRKVCDVVPALERRMV